MKPVVALVVSFIVATAAATGAKVVLTKPSAAPSDSTHADSTHADSTQKDSTHAGADTAAVASGQPARPPADTMPHVASPDSAKVHAATTATTAATATTQAGAPAAVPVKPVAAPTVSDTMASAPERRIAKVFTSMDAKQAAKVLEHMADGDVQVILGYVGVKQAAQIMAALPPERVAILSKLSMGKNK